MSFDPYKEWLGIRSANRPPTHYELVGVTEFETDPDKIHQAALQQIAKVRKHQTGKHSDLTQAVMNEISLARVCLLDQTRRGEYDIKLSLERTSGAAPAVAGAPATNASRSLVMAPLAALAVLAVLTAVFLFIPNRAPTETSEADRAAGGADSGAEGASGSRPIESPRPDLSRVEPLAGFRVLWEETAAGETAGQSFARGDFNESRVSLDVSRRRLDLSQRPGRRLDLYLPAPKGDFRILAHFSDFKLADPRQVAMLGAFRSPAEFIAAALLGEKPPAASLTMAPTGKGAIPSAPAAHESALWLELRRKQNRWSVYQSTDGEVFSKVGEQTAPFEPAALGVVLDNGSPLPMPVFADYLRIEGDDDGYSSRLQSWPRIPPLPNSDRLAEMFQGEFALSAGGAARQEYNFLFDKATAPWGGQRSRDGSGVLLSPGRTVEHGPMNRLWQIDFRFCFPESDKQSLELAFSDGGVIRLDSGKGAVIARYAKDAENGAEEIKADYSFEKDHVYRCSITLAGTGSLKLLLDGRTVLTGAARGMNGRLATRAVDGAVEISEFTMDGQYDGASLWLAGLAGEINALSRPDNRPDELSVKIIRPAGPGPAFKILRRADGSAEPLQPEPGRPQPLAFLNTPDDESGPWLEAEGLTLHFSRASKDREQLLFGRRTAINEQFSSEGTLLGLPEEGRQQAPTLPADRLSLIFASNLQGNFELYRATRESVSSRFSTPLLLNATSSKADESQPALSADGQELYFSRQEKEGELMYRTSISKDSGRFVDPVRVEAFGRGFQRPSVTGDGLTMYLQGPIKQGRFGIYRSTRESRNRPWGRPVVVDLGASEGKRGDLSPFVTGDGRLLYFATDRDATGGLDLWVASLSPTSGRPGGPGTLVTKNSPKSEAPASKPTKTAEPKPAEPKAAVAAKPGGQVEGSIGEWLIAGPFPKEKIAGANSEAALRSLMPPALLRRIPSEGDKIEQHVWRRSAKLDGGPGAYLVAAPIELRQIAEVVVSITSSPGGAMFWFDNQPAVKVWEYGPWQKGGSADERSEPIRVFRGKHRLLGVVCVPGEGIPLEVQLLDAATKGPLKDAFLDF